MTRILLLTLTLGAGTLAAAQSVNTIPATPLSAPTQTVPVQTTPERTTYPSGYTAAQLQAAAAALQGLPGLSALELDPTQGRVRVTVGTAVQRVAVLGRLTQAGLPTGLVTFAPNAPGATGTVTETPTTPPATTPPVGTTDPIVTPVPGGRVTVTELASGTNAAVSDPAVQVATTQSALNALYRVAYGNQTGTPAVPTLRSGETVVGVFLGQRPTGGYGVQVTGASVQNGVLTLTVNIRAPGPGAITTQALTSPWTLVRVPGTFTRVQLVDAAGRPIQLGTGTGTGQAR
ncbi:protease complex subunit PrcB family protein [Deinococcus sp. SDU3-2]|uniref:Protease complex subunit PrcB family protein n=1 Tax=Deinococcus terrestris TaxID=2651870 RepID=A0A7X1TQ48_9DEIO|nr:protease complex subunit PrcB family protein [Deinococcus terrestris]MPY65260.1 protease complex subunit PrcB family protein [Deinococcus terrestris]